VSEEDEFLKPLDLSVPKDPTGRSQKPLVRAVLLLALLGLWTWGVFVFFSRESDESLPLPVSNVLTISTPTPLPTEIRSSSTPMPLPPPELRDVIIETDPSGVTLLREGQFVGTSPFKLPNPEVGQELRFRLNGFEPEVFLLTQRHLDEGVQVQLKAILGQVLLKIHPDNCRVLLDGKLLTLPENGILNLPVREHTLQVSSPGYKTAERTITPAEAYERTLSISLEPIPTPTPVMAPGEEHGAEESNTKNSQNLEMLRPPFPLTATVGSPRGTAGRQSNEVEVKVALKREFRISKSEISNAQFRIFRPEHQSGRWKSIDLNADTLPVVNVRWEDAVAYCNWLSEQEKLPPAYVKKGDRWEVDENPGTGYRLPTEAEWETLARSEGKHFLFGWGDEMPPPQGSLNVAGKESSKLFASVVTGYQDSFTGPAPVDKAAEGGPGLSGLYGNVMEWVQDGYSIPPRSSKVFIDPRNATAKGFHVIKGASWRDAGVVDLRIARRRYGNQPAVDIGFRVARYISQKP